MGIEYETSVANLIGMFFSALCIGLFILGPAVLLGVNPFTFWFDKLMAFLHS